MSPAPPLRPWPGARLWVAQALPADVPEPLPEAWCASIWEAVSAGDWSLRRDVPLPEEAGRAVVKVYRRRESHGLLRRLRRGRAAREAAGYAAFARAALHTVPFVFAGEQHARGLHVFGLVVTVQVDAPTVAQVCTPALDADLLRATADALATIHRAGLCHGDPRTRNFLATPDGPLPFDLPSWRPFGRAAQLQDLERLLGSALLLGATTALLDDLLARLAGGPALPLAAAALHERAARWAAGKPAP